MQFLILGKNLKPGACIIKLITAVIYGFNNMLECLSVNTNKAEKACQGQTLKLITETVNYGRNKFYETGPWSHQQMREYICLSRFAKLERFITEKNFHCFPRLCKITKTVNKLIPKILYEIEFRAQCYKVSYVCKLQIFVIC